MLIRERGGKRGQDHPGQPARRIQASSQSGRYAKIPRGNRRVASLLLNLRRIAPRPPTSDHFLREPSEIRYSLDGLYRKSLGDSFHLQCRDPWVIVSPSQLEDPPCGLLAESRHSATDNASIDPHSALFTPTGDPLAETHPPHCFASGRRVIETRYTFSPQLLRAYGFSLEIASILNNPNPPCAIASLTLGLGGFTPSHLHPFFPDDILAGRLFKYTPQNFPHIACSNALRMGGLKLARGWSGDWKELVILMCRIVPLSMTKLEIIQYVLDESHWEEFARLRTEVRCISSSCDSKNYK